MPRRANGKQNNNRIKVIYTSGKKLEDFNKLIAPAYDDTKRHST